jgi:hypothetical protein
MLQCKTYLLLNLIRSSLSFSTNISSKISPLCCLQEKLNQVFVLHHWHVNPILERPDFGVVVMNHPKIDAVTSGSKQQAKARVPFTSNSFSQNPTWGPCIHRNDSSIVSDPKKNSTSTSPVPGGSVPGGMKVGSGDLDGGGSGAGLDRVSFFHSKVLSAKCLGRSKIFFFLRTLYVICTATAEMSTKLSCSKKKSTSTLSSEWQWLQQFSTGG